MVKQHFLPLLLLFLLIANVNARRIKLRQFKRQNLAILGDWEFGSTYRLSRNYFSQEVNVAFDLESPLQLLYDANSVKEQGWPASDQYYKPDDSSSFKTQNQTFKLDFNLDTQPMKSSVSGVWAQDSVFQLLNGHSSTYDNAEFGLIQQGDAFQPNDTVFPYTGRLGMALNGSNSKSWFVEAMRKDEGGMLTFIMAVNGLYLGVGNDESDDANCDDKSLITEPVVDTSPEVGKQHWQFQAKSLSFGKYFFTTPQFVRFTLSSAYIYGPTELVQKLRTAVKAFKQGDQWVVQCDGPTKPTITFGTAKGELDLPPSLYVLRDEKTDKCYLAITNFSDPKNTDHWAFGTLFTAKYCLSLDYNNQQLLFRNSKVNSGINLGSEFIRVLSKKN